MANETRLGAAGIAEPRKWRTLHLAGPFWVGIRTVSGPPMIWIPRARRTTAAAQGEKATVLDFGFGWWIVSLGFMRAEPDSRRGADSEPRRS